VTCVGDIHVDTHHSVEDIGICLGTAFEHALGDRRGIGRYGDVTIPMDEALVLCAVDISGRSHLGFDVTTPDHAPEAMGAELLEEFLQAFVRKSGITVHMRMYGGKNSHHILEACFKALARALCRAVRIETRFRDEIPSTKGLLD